MPSWEKGVTNISVCADKNFYKKGSNFWGVLKVTKDLKHKTGWNICQINKQINMN